MTFVIAIFFIWDFRHSVVLLQIFEFSKKYVSARDVNSLKKKKKEALSLELVSWLMFIQDFTELFKNTPTIFRSRLREIIMLKSINCDILIC